jgi:TPR repeat protein
MKYSKLAFLATALSMAQASTAFSQAAPQQQRVAPTDTCARIPDPDAADCAHDAMMDQNWPAFLKWAQKTAAEGDSIRAYWLGDVYESGENGLSKDLVRAYMWYDIAAQLHDRQIQQMPAAQNPTDTEDNKQEINSRDAVGEHLTPAQKAEALRLEREWFSAHR